MNPPAAPGNPDTPDTPDRRRNRRTTAIGVTAGLLGGGAIGLLVAMPSFGSAATQATTTPTTEVVVDRRHRDRRRAGRTRLGCRP